MFISTKAISRHCTADLAIKVDESLQGTTFKKNDGEKENNSSSTQKGVKKVKFYENPGPHILYHADTREVTLGNGSLIYQISVEDDYSRDYMALCVFQTKHSYFVTEWQSQI